MHRASRLSHLDYHHGFGQATDDAVTLYPPELLRLRVPKRYDRGVLGNKGTLLHNVVSEPRVLRRVDKIQGSRQHSNSLTLSVQRTVVGHRVDASRESANDAMTGPGQLFRQKASGRHATVRS